MEVSDGRLGPQDEVRAHVQQRPRPAGDYKGQKMILGTTALHYATALNRGEGTEKLRKVPIRMYILEGSCSRGIGRRVEWMDTGS